LGTSFPAGSSFTRIVLTVENLTDPLSTNPDIIGVDTDLNAVPFTPVPFRIDFIPLWIEENIVITDLRRFVPKTFTSIESSDITGDTKSGGTNTTLIPGDVLLSGALLDEDANIYSIDLEVGTIVLDLPEGATAAEVDVFNSFIKNQMRFSDGTLVGSSALDDEQVRVTASVQSIAKDLDGYDYESSTWWNSSWKNRYRINISNRDSKAHDFEIIKLNISGTSCSNYSNSTRIQYNDSGTWKKVDKNGEKLL